MLVILVCYSDSCSRVGHGHGYMLKYQESNMSIRGKMKSENYIG